MITSPPRASDGSPLHLAVPSLLVLLGLVVSPGTARAQSVVVSVPNTDVTRPGVTMVAHESQLNTWSYGYPYWNSFSFSTYGIGQNMELAATLYGLSAPGALKLTLAVGYKHRIPLDESSPWEPTVAFGPMLPFSLSGAGVGVWVYGAASFRLPATRTRFTVGPSYGTSQIFGATTASVLAAVEQPLTRRVHLIADWFSGRHELGALVPAVQVNVTPAFIVIAGVKIPNSPRAGPLSALVELTYEFGHEGH